MAAGTDVVLDDLDGVPGLARRAPARPPGSRRSRPTCGRAARVLVAYSGGADSAFLLAAAVRALGPDRVAAATGYSDSLPQAERDPARDFAAVARRRGAHAADPRDGARGLPRQRRRPLLLLQGRADRRPRPAGGRARARRTSRPAPTPTTRSPASGPGIRAAAERGAVTPLRDAGLTKAQVREASRRWGLPTWDKPAAACLSSRVAYGIEVTPHRLARVERAEAAVAGRCWRGRRTGARPAGPRPGGPGLGRGRRRACSPGRWPRTASWPAGCSTTYAAPASPRPPSTPAASAPGR